MYKIIVSHEESGLIFNLTEKCFYGDTSNNNSVPIKEVAKYLKGIFSTKDKLVRDFMRKGHPNPLKDFTSSEINERLDGMKEFIDTVLEEYETAVPYTYEEAFKIENEPYKALVFGSIDIVEMINKLGHERHKVEGIPVKRKQFDSVGNFLGYKEYDNIYEVHKINNEPLGVREDIYALRVWCTSTNQEHWIWIESKYKDDPLEAIASTFRIHENVIPKIKELKRQGDVMIVELTEKVKPEGNIVPLTKEQYFGLLTTET